MGRKQRRQKRFTRDKPNKEGFCRYRCRADAEGADLELALTVTFIPH